MKNNIASFMSVFDIWFHGVSVNKSSVLFSGVSPPYNATQSVHWMLNSSSINEKWYVSTAEYKPFNRHCRRIPKRDWVIWSVYWVCTRGLHYWPTSVTIYTVGELRSTLCTKTPLYVRSDSYIRQIPLEHVSYIKQMPLEHLSYIKETSWNTSDRT